MSYFYHDIFNDNERERLVAEKMREVVKWKVYNVSGFWTFNRSVILVAYVGYEQELIVTEFYQYSKCRIQDFVKILKDKTINVRKSLKRDECLYKTAINDKKFIRKATKHLFDFNTMKYIDVENLENEEELLEVFYESNQIKLPDEMQLSQPVNKTALLFLIHFFESRLIGSPIKCRRTVKGRHLYIYYIERLPGDPDCRHINPHRYSMY